VPRTRSRLIPLAGGGVRHWQFDDNFIISHVVQEPNNSYPEFSSVCVDEVNRRTSDNPLSIITDVRSWEPMNGSGISIGGSTFYYKNWIPTGAYASREHPPELLSSIPSVGEVATSVLARSNPSRPDISLPNFLFELKDLPQMIRDIGRLRLQARNASRKGLQRIHPKVAANHYLSYEMGWRPLIGDLRRLLDFQANVDKKLRELQNLYAKGGIQRRVRNPGWMYTHVVEPTTYTVESGTAFLMDCKLTSIHTVERWGTVRWSPAALPDPRFSSSDMAKLARDLSFGIRGISTKQVWDAIPWTWLIGWFTNADEFLQAHDNRIPLNHSVPCIMTTRFSRWDSQRNDIYTGIVTGGNGAQLRGTKERVTSSGTLSATLPFLSKRQLSILAALHIQRRR
jgi:hypothetical protein